MKFYGWVLVALCGFGPAAGQVDLRTYRIETIAGSQRNGDGGPATAAQISNIQGIARDLQGNLYLSDTDHHRVRRVTAGGIITTVAGTGVAGYAGDGGPAVRAQLNLPYGLAVDATGNLYIADLGNNRIRRVWPDGVITTVIPETSLATPRNVALDPAGNLYFSEFDGQRVRRISPDGRVTTAAGNGRAGFSGDGGPPEQAQLAFPCGIAIDRGGALLIADAGNNRVRRIFANGTLGTLLGGSSGTALATPVAIATDAQGTIYVGDAAPVVRAFSLAGRWSDIAGSSAPGFSGDNAPALRAAISPVRDLAVDAASNLYLADGPRVRRIDLSGIINTIAGDGFLHAIGDGGAAPDAVLARPSALALDSAGNLTIADTGTERIRQVASGTITTLAGTGVASTGALNEPMGLAADGAGTLYVADTGNSAIRTVAADRRLRTIAAAVKQPRGVCVSRGGALYTVDTGNGRVLRITASTTDVVAAQLTAPEACALDSFGNLFVAETGAHRVRRLSPAGVWTTVAGTGVAGSDGDEGPAAAGRLSFPRGVAVTDDGRVYISDTGGNRIRLVTADGVIHTIAGMGEAGFSGDGEDARSARLYAPAGLALDGAGSLYVADSGNDRIRRLNPYSPIAELVAAVGVVNAASGVGGGVAPGELVRVSGAGFGGDVPAEVWFGTHPAAVLTCRPGELIVQVPEELAGADATDLEVRVAGKTVGAAAVGVTDAAPGVLPLVFNEDGSVNNALGRAAAGSALTLFATGQGKLSLARPVLPVRVTIAGVSAEVVRAEAAAGATGLLLLVVRVPGGFVPMGEAPLLLTVGIANAEPVGIWLR
jgi:uncharacterized protein (TIGR03437 family)